VVTESLVIPRYKIIVQTSIGQQRDQGIRIASRCLWDVSTDNYTTVSYTNVSVLCYLTNSKCVTANVILQCPNFCIIHGLNGCMKQ
jgi:hypothetical protein